MDKNMVNIDDLLRQRLTGGEEEERAGAWLKMRDLLDEKMPEKVVAVYNWRRMFTYAAGLLLLASATVGSYKAYEAFRAASENVKAGNGAATAASKTSGGLVSGMEGNITANSAATASNTAAANANVSNTVSENPETNGNNSADGAATNATNNKIVAAAGKPTKVSKAMQDVIATSDKVVNSVKINKKSLLSALVFTKPATLPVDQMAYTPSLNENMPSFQVDYSDATNSNGTGSTVYNNGTTNSNQPGNTGIIVAGNTGNERKKLSPEETNPRYKKEQRIVDSFNMVAIRESNRKGYRTEDTFNMGKIGIERTIPVTDNANTNTVAANADITPAAALPADAAAEKGAYAPLSDFKTESKKRKSYNPNRFEEMIRNARLDLTGVTLRPGIVAGITSTTGNYNMMGVQFGIAGIMTMSEKWSMFAELKYIYRFGNGKSVTNQYNQLIDSGKSGNQMVYRYEDRTNYYEFATNSSVELPVALRYSIRRVNLIAGINASYHFAMNPSPRDEVYKREIVGEPGMSSQLNAEWKKDARVTYNDFGSRFSMGGVLGIGYQITPAVGVDIRATQSVWDNVTTRGALQVSKYLYRTTNFQVNFVYRFSNNKYQRPRVR
ncbi:MAG TPA: hypothetical protein VGD89_15080 [Flavipsychrobacter sp.]